VVGLDYFHDICIHGIVHWVKWPSTASLLGSFSGGNYCRQAIIKRNKEEKTPKRQQQTKRKNFVKQHKNNIALLITESTTCIIYKSPMNITIYCMVSWSPWTGYYRLFNAMPLTEWVQVRTFRTSDTDWLIDWVIKALLPTKHIIAHIGDGTDWMNVVLLICCLIWREINLFSVYSSRRINDAASVISCALHMPVA